MLTAEDKKIINDIMQEVWYVNGRVRYTTAEYAFMEALAEKSMSMCKRGDEYDDFIIACADAIEKFLA